MHFATTARRATFLSLSLSAASVGCAQTATTPAPTNGLPPSLVEIPGGKVTMGLEAKEFLEMAKTLAPQSESARRAIIANCLSELGVVTVDVERCFMAKHPVTNAEYKVFVEATGARFPYHWWTDGRKDDFESKERRLAIAELPPSHDKNVTYWETNWKKLPWAIPAGAEKHPVTNVSWAEAIAYAAWAGMRLPTEAEWTLAATGGKAKNYLLGDTWTNDWLEGLRLKNNADRRGTKPVGAVSQFASGPYGHDDMIGGVWEWMFDNEGYVQRAPRRDFDREFDKLKKSSGLTDLLPEFKDEHRILKGGSYLSAASPVQMRLGVRAHATMNETQPAAGFRLAKSLLPARDMTRARIRIEYDYSAFGNRTPAVDDQIGIERYTLEKDAIKAYEAVSFVPVSDIGYDERDPENRKTPLDERTRQTPIIVGTVITTVKLATPKLEPGIYTVYYRAKDLPKELEQALRAGQRELVAAAKAAKSGAKEDKKKKEEKKEEAKAEEKKEPDWRAIVQKYGVTEQEVLEQGPKLTTLRTREGDHAFSVENNLYLFRSNGDATAVAQFVANEATSQRLEHKGGYRGAKLSLIEKDGRPAVTATLGVPGPANRHYMFDMTLVIDDAVDTTRPWRVPPGASVTLGATGGNAGNGTSPGPK